MSETITADMARWAAELQYEDLGGKAIEEARRCMSCGNCFDCGTCWSFCQDNVIGKPLVRGEPYTFKMEFCTGCKKCSEVCPCGYIMMS